MVEADIDHPTDADLLEHAVRKLGGLVRRIKGRVPPPGPGFGIVAVRPAGGEAVGPDAAAAHRVAMVEVDQLTGGVARIARQTLRDVQGVVRNARRVLARRPGGGWLGRLVGELQETRTATGPLLAQTDQRLAGNRVIPDRLVSLADPVQRVVAVTGRAPGTVVGDRGFGTAANDRALEGLGVKRIGLQRTGTPGKARPQDS